MSGDDLVKRDLIGGQWVGEEAVPNTNPSDLSDTVGIYAHGSVANVSREGVDVGKSEFHSGHGPRNPGRKNIPRFERLAERLAATGACSRPLADLGWLLKSRQVELTGKPAGACKLNLPLGICGAVQHLWGIEHVEMIIGVDSDANAPIFSVATYGVVDDLFEFTDALEKALSEQLPPRRFYRSERVCHLARGSDAILHHCCLNY